jgi:hypothetical protein
MNNSANALTYFQSHKSSHEIRCMKLMGARYVLNPSINHRVIGRVHGPIVPAGVLMDNNRATGQWSPRGFFSRVMNFLTRRSSMAS